MLSILLMVWRLSTVSKVLFNSIVVISAVKAGFAVVKNFPHCLRHMWEESVCEVAESKVVGRRVWDVLCCVP